MATCLSIALFIRFLAYIPANRTYMYVVIDVTLFSLFRYNCAISLASPRGEIKITSQKKVKSRKGGRGNIITFRAKSFHSPLNFFPVSSVIVQNISSDAAEE